MENQKLKKYFSAIIKLVVSTAALYYVFQQIDLDATLSLFKTVHFGWLILASLAFVLSKVISALRLHSYFESTGLNITSGYNIRLYWIGMFYNLFLPGGIGGDGYKIYILRKQHTVSTKSLISATLLDRINGLFALLILAIGLALFIPEIIAYQNLICLALLLLSLPSFWLFNKLLFGLFLPKLISSTLLSIGVQVSQLVCAWFILLSLGVDTQILVYQFVFLISSMVAVLPFTIGGVGARELTFVLSHEYLGIDQNLAVAFSLIFFLITAVCSLPGILLKENAD